MRLARFWRRLGRLSLLSAVAVLMGLGGAGCHSYHYYDVQVTFDSASTPAFTRSVVTTIVVCQVTISGADATEFDLPHNNSPDQRCPNLSPTANSLDGGMFEYSTFTDSGMLTFTLDAYQDFTRTADCHVGAGSVSVPATSAITTTAEIKVKNTGMSCTTTGNTPGPDGSIILD